MRSDVAARFLVLTYRDSKLGPIGCILFSDGPGWRVVGGTEAMVGSPKYDAIQARFASTLGNVPKIAVAHLAVDHNDIGDGERLWQLATEGDAR